MIGIFVNLFNLFYPGSHPGSTVLLMFIELVPTVFPNRILKTFLNPFSILISDLTQKKNNIHELQRDTARIQESRRAAALTVSSALATGCWGEVAGNRCLDSKMSAGMFYTDIFIEVAMPFPPCRSRIPVSLY
jgi:hypothetical protein